MAEAAEQARQQAQAGADKARGALRTQVDQRSTDAGQRVNSLVSDVRTVSEQLREQGKDQPAKLAEQAAERLEKAGSWLTESDADKILREVEDFGRQRPWAVIGAGIAIGVAASRMLKASSTQRYETSRPASAPTYTGTGGSMTTPQPRGIPHTSGTGLQETPATTPRTGEGTWSGPGNGTTY